MSVSKVAVAGGLVVCALWGCTTTAPDPAAAQEREAATAAALQRCDPKAGYKVGSGDVVSIRVYGGEEEQRWERVRLDDSGMVTLPSGQFQVRGRTTKQIEAEVTESLKRQFRNPRVWVNVDEYRPFFVEGQVGRPGAYPYQIGLNVRQAVTIGGGFRERADQRKIYVAPEGDRSAKRQRVGLATPVCPGDTVTVEESLF